MWASGLVPVFLKCLGGVSEVGSEGAQEGKGVAGKSHGVSSVNERHPRQDVAFAAKSSQGRRLPRAARSGAGFSQNLNGIRDSLIRVTSP